MKEKKLVLVGTSSLLKNSEAVHLLTEHGLELVSFEQFRGIICPDGGESRVAAIVLGSDTCGKDEMDCFPNLKTIARWGTGYDNVDLKEAEMRGIVVSRTAQANTKAVAELVLGNIINLSRNIVICHQDLIAGNWKRRSAGTMLCDLTVGIIGMGGIGRTVARMLHALNVKKILYWNRTRRDQVVESESKFGMNFASIEDVLARSSIVIVALASCEETRLLINKDRLSCLSPSSAIINVGRGEVVDEDALAGFLEEGKIAGAALDVFSVEPPMGKPFFTRLQALAKKNVNVILTPHIGANGSESHRVAPVAIAKNIIGALSGKLEDVEIVSQ